MKHALAALTLATLAACGTVTPGGLIAAARLDPLGTPPGDVAIAVSVPEALRLGDGDATLRLSFLPEGADGPVVDAIVPLSVTTAGPAPRAAPGMRVYAAAIPPVHQRQIADAQAEIRALREAGTEGEGSLTIDISGGCLTGPPGDALPVSTWLRTDPRDDFTRLTRARDARDLLSAEAYAALRARLRPC